MTADALDRLPCGVLSFRDDGRIVRANRTLCELLELGEEALEGRHVETLFTTGTRIFYQTHFFPLVRLHGRAEEVYLALRSKAGREVGVLANAVRVSEGGEALIHCTLMRVLQRKKFEEELLRARKSAEEALAQNSRLLEEAAVARAEAERANAAKSDFLAMVSHEIRTPINAILGYTDLLDGEVAGELTEVQRGYVARVRAGGRHLRTVVSDLLDLAKIESGGLAVGRGEASLDEAIEMALSMVQPLARERDIDLVGPPPAEGATYVGDPDRVRQILINLLNNAIKFTDAGGRVWVEVGAGEAPPAVPPGGENSDLAAGAGAEGPLWRHVRVRDTGVGIAEEALESIFEPFRQFAREGGGTGLGLTISRRLARAMDGDLTVASRPGEGSCFTLWLRAPAGARTPAGAAGETGP